MIWHRYYSDRLYLIDREHDRDMRWNFNWNWEEPSSPAVTNEAFLPCLQTSYGHRVYLKGDSAALRNIWCICDWC